MCFKFFTLIPICLLLTFSSFTQGFNQKIDANYRALAFTNVSIEDDTICLLGISADTVFPYRWGVCLIKMDTLGNILSGKAHYTDEDFWSPTYRQGFIKLSGHKGYAIVGTHFNTQRGYLLRLNEQGDLIYLKRYPKGTFDTNYWQSIIEVSDGFVAGANRGSPINEVNIYIIKLDVNGNKKWEKSVGDSKLDNLTDLVKENNNEYVVAESVIVNFFTPPASDDRAATCLTGIDSLGNTLWSWTSPIALDETGGAKGIRRQGNGDWLYATSRSEFMDGSWFVQPKVVRRDSNFNLIWEKNYGTLSFDEGSFNDFRPYPGNGYVGTGFSAYGLFKTGVVYRLDADCNAIWSRVDTAFYDPAGVAENILAASAFLSSRSIISCGQTVNYDEQKSYGWLLKITPDGCIDTLFCNPFVSTSPLPEPGPMTVRVFPNPAHGLVNFQTSTGSGGQLILSDSYGKIQAIRELPGDQSTFTMDCSNLRPGIYFYQFMHKSRKTSIGRFVIME